MKYIEIYKEWLNNKHKTCKISAKRSSYILLLFIILVLIRATILKDSADYL